MKMAPRVKCVLWSMAKVVTIFWKGCVTCTLDHQPRPTARCAVRYATYDFFDIHGKKTVGSWHSDRLPTDVLVRCMVKYTRVHPQLREFGGVRCYNGEIHIKGVYHLELLTDCLCKTG